MPASLVIPAAEWAVWRAGSLVIETCKSWEFCHSRPARNGRPSVSLLYVRWGYRRLTADSSPRIVSGNEWLERIARFRVHVWRSEGMLSDSCFTDGRCLEAIDKEAIQVVMLDQGKLMGAIRYYQYENPRDCASLCGVLTDSVSIPAPMATPERLVVDPEYKRQGVFSTLGRAVRALCYRHGARCMVSECAPPVAKALRDMGRQSLGMAPPDPRFPGVRYEWILSLVDLDNKPPDLPF